MLTKRFIVWRKNQEEFVSNHNKEKPNIYDLENDYDLGYFGDCLVGERKNNIILQSIGFSDKNGSEIFEQFILEYNFHDKDNEIYESGIGIVKHGLNGWSLLVDGEMKNIWQDKDLWTFEIIGNTYENQEMAEQIRKF